MPPRKSNASITSNGAEDGAEATPVKAPKDGISVEDLSLPKSMIARLAKGVLPANTQVHKDALLALHKSATVFVSYLASNSNEFAQAGGKKTIAPQDVMAALKECELAEFIPRLEAELKKYNEVQCDKRNTYRRKVKEEKAAAAVTDGVEGETSTVSETLHDTTMDEASIVTLNGHGEVDDEDRPTKKFKTDDGSATILDASGLEDDDMGDDEDEEVDEQHEDDDVEDEDEDEDDEPDEDPGAQLVDDLDPDELPSTSHVHDEALDDDGTESD